MITKINFDKNKKMLTLNFNNEHFNRKGISLINIGSLLTFNYINNNNISYGNNYKRSFSSENKNSHKNNYFYSLPNSTNYIYKNKYNNGSLSSKNNSKTKIIFIKKTGPFCEKNINEVKIKNKSNFSNFVEKCNDLKKRTKNILNKYIKLSESFSKNKIINNKNKIGL